MIQGRNHHECPGNNGGHPERLREIATLFTDKGGGFWYVYECQHGHSHLGGAA